jgi:NodT family efflux transporter outer membrane factor (OMF) lipoprotein
LSKQYFLFLLVGLTAGCAVGPDYAAPDIAVPAEWHASAEGGETRGPVDLTEWWKVFGDATLNALIDEATKANFDLRIADARIRESRAVRGIVAADLYPNVGVSGSYQRRQVAEPEVDDTSISFGGSANDYSLSRSTTLRSGNWTASTSSSATRLGALLFGGGTGGNQGNAGGQGGQQGGGSILKPFQNRNISYSPDSQPTFDRTQDYYQAGFDASWELDIFGGNRRAVEAANADITAVEEGRRDILVSLLAEVARNYLTLREAQARLSIAKENIQSQKGTVDLTQARFDAGLTSEFDVTRAKAQLAVTSSQVPALESSIAATIHRLSVLLGKDPAALYGELTSETPLPPTPPDVPMGVPSDLLRRRADVRQAERELAAATARIGEATADLFPKFSLTGNFGFQGNKLNDLTIGANQIWGFGPSISWPIFDAGRIRANINVQDARQEQALIAYEKAVKVSLEDVETSLVAYAKEQDRYKWLDTAVTAEKQSVALANERYVRGLSDFVNVLDAQRSLYLAQDQLVQSQTTVLLNLVTLYKALGGGWESFEAASAPEVTDATTEQG